MTVHFVSFSPFSYLSTFDSAISDTLCTLIQMQSFSRPDTVCQRMLPQGLWSELGGDQTKSTAGNQTDREVTHPLTSSYSMNKEENCIYRNPQQSRNLLL